MSSHSCVGEPELASMEERIKPGILTLHGVLDRRNEDGPHHRQRRPLHSLPRLLYLDRRFDGYAFDGLGCHRLPQLSRGKAGRETAGISRLGGLHLRRLPLEYDGGL